MGNGEQPPKIGIGPEGRLGGLIQFLIITILGIVIFVYNMDPVTILMKIIPVTLVMLIVLGHLVLMGDNWPLAPPGGNWTPAKSRLIPGIGLTVLWALLTTVITAFMANAFPQWPISPLFLWFGAIGFCTTLLYGINWNCWPFKGKMHPWATMVIAFIIVMIISAIVWSFTNLSGTPLANSPFDKKGPLQVDWLTGYLVWFIAWFFVFSPVFTTQQAIFAKLGHPGGAIGQTIVALILGYICWAGSLGMGVSPTFSFGAVASSIIFWALVYSWHLQFWGITKLTGGKRAFAAFVIEIILVIIWIVIMNVALGPAAEKFAAMKLPADVNILILYTNLCIIGPAMIAHNAFWLRWPLTLPNPPGTPPPDQSV